MVKARQLPSFFSINPKINVMKIKKIMAIVFGFILLILLLLSILIINNCINLKEEPASSKLIIMQYKFYNYLKVKATCYHPVVAQCDDSPFLTATGARIDSVNPLKHRWAAVSRDLEKEFGLAMGDTIEVFGTFKYDGKWCIKDRTSSRLKKTVDFLIGVNDYGNMWPSITIRWVYKRLIHVKKGKFSVALGKYK